MTDDVSETEDGGGPVLDLSVWRRPIIVSCWGRKGSGKSVLNRRLYSTWPGDKLAIDVNGNAEPGADAERLTDPLPKRWPTQVLGLGERRRPRNLHYRADPGSDTYADDLDRAVGVAIMPQEHPVCVWGGEVGELMPNGRPGPSMRRLLMQNRHYKTTALFDGPRPVWVDKLVLVQSDLVAIYDLPDPDDRARIAKTIGYPPRRFSEECDTTFRRGDFWFLLWDTAAKKLYRHPPIEPV